MTFVLTEAVAVLERTPRLLWELLLGLEPSWVINNYGDNTFSPFDVVGHLLEAEKHNWMVRVMHILTHGEAAPFPVFDRYAMYRTSQGKAIDQLLGEFAAARAVNLEKLSALNLTESELSRRGLHPELGPVTLQNLLAAWVVHDLGHTHQVVKSMAFQYRDAVGPWFKFLTILPR